MYAVMLYNDDCNIISYRIDRHLQNRIVYTTRCVTRRIRSRKYKHFSRVRVTLSSRYNTGLIDEYFFYALLGLPSDVER